MEKNHWDPEKFRQHFEVGTASNKVLSSMEERKLEFYLTKLALKRTDIILDVGCGYGRFGVHVRDKVSKVIGIDINPDNITYAEKLVGDKFEGHVCDLSKEALPIADNSIDKVVMDNVLMFLTGQEQVALFMELKRVVKSGGVVVFSFENADYLFMPILRVLDAMRQMKSSSTGKQVAPKHHRLSLSFYQKALFDAEFFNVFTLGNSYYRKLGVGSIELLPPFLHNYILRLDKKHSVTKKHKQMSTLSVAATKK
jgi:ubiquinone/menaquinone biosynthesis C-methylase UbiE